jgi:hypothetical protein
LSIAPFILEDEFLTCYELCKCGGDLPPRHEGTRMIKITDLSKGLFSEVWILSSMFAVKIHRQLRLILTLRKFAMKVRRTIAFERIFGFEV